MRYLSKNAHLTGRVLGIARHDLVQTAQTTKILATMVRHVEALEQYTSASIGFHKLIPRRWTYEQRSSQGHH